MDEDFTGLVRVTRGFPTWDIPNALVSAAVVELAKDWDRQMKEVHGVEINQCSIVLSRSGVEIQIPKYIRSPIGSINGGSSWTELEQEQIREIANEVYGLLDALLRSQKFVDAVDASPTLEDTQQMPAITDAMIEEDKRKNRKEGRTGGD